MMEILEYQIKFGRIFGIVYPKNGSKLRKAIFRLNRIEFFFLPPVMIICQLVQIFKSIDDPDTLRDTVFTVVTLTSAWLRAAIVICKQKDLIKLMTILRKNNFVPRDHQELEIHEKWENLLR